MKVAGGVIAIIVGLIQLILSAIAVLFTEGMSAVADEVNLEEARNRLAELEAGNASQAEIDAARTALELLDTGLGTAATLSWIFLLIGLATFVLGIMVLSMRSQPVGAALAVVGIVGVAISIVLGGGLTSIIWSGLIVLAGVFGWLGAKPQTAAA